MHVQNNEADFRFEAEVDGHRAFLDYKLKGNTIALVHTEVPAELEGRGIGGDLARAALEHARHQGLKVLPYCTFVAAYIKQHPEYAVLVPSTYQPRGTAS